MSDLVMTMSNFIFSQCFYLRCIFMFLLYSGNKMFFLSSYTCSFVSKYIKSSDSSQLQFISLLKLPAENELDMVCHSVLTYSTFQKTEITLRVYSMNSRMHNRAINSSPSLTMINSKCKSAPSVSNQLTVKITFVGNLMFSRPIPPSSSHYWCSSCIII